MNASDSSHNRPSPSDESDAIANELLRRPPPRLSRSARIVVSICDYMYRPFLRLYGLVVSSLLFVCGLILPAFLGVEFGPVRLITYCSFLFLLSIIVARAAVRSQDRRISLRYPSKSQ
jgi:hypothetical protein